MTATLTAFPAPISGDATTIQRQYESAAAYNAIADSAERRLWGSTSYVPRVGNRRMVAVGVTGKGMYVAPFKGLSLEKSSRA